MADKAHVILVGKVAFEPKTSQTANGNFQLRFSVNVMTTKKQENSNYPATDLYNVTAYGEYAKKLLPQIVVGTKLTVIGDMHMGEPYTNRQGKTTVTPFVTASSIDIANPGKQETKTEEDPF